LFRRADCGKRSVVDDAVQNSLDALLHECTALKAAAPAKRLDLAVNVISDSTTKVLARAAEAKRTRDKDSAYLRKPGGKVTAADLSEELSSQEIDQWLESMPPRERALSLFLYASNVTPRDIAEAVGEKPAGLSRRLDAGRANLMRIFDENWQEPAPASTRSGPAMQFSESGGGFAALMKTTAPPEAAPSAAPAPAGSSPTGNAPAADAAPAIREAATPPSAGSGLGALKVTGISDVIYSGWSLLATARDLPRGQRVSVTQPFLLEPDSPRVKRMLVTDIAEIGDPSADTRRFLLKAYAIDADRDAAGVRDGFHLGAPLTNDEARKTLANPTLSSIEVARCLWHDFGTGPEPGLCRREAASP
jgi:DNA-directed RNA polymerase specialized sigma24 family protein